MVLGKKCRWRSNEGLGLAFVRYTRSFVRKRRSVMLNNMDVDSTVITPIKKHCNEKLNLGSEKSMIEMLPQDILIRVLCGVEHDDLKRVFYVSKSIREAALIAKKWHFAYSTPKKRLAFRNAVHLGDCGEFDEVEAPNAPKQWRIAQSRLIGKKAEEGRSRGELFTEMETESILEYSYKSPSSL